MALLQPKTWLMACRSAAVVLAAITFLGIARAEETKKEEIKLDQLPEAVIKAVKEKFPKAKLIAAMKEVEKGQMLFEVSLKDQGRAIEVDLTPSGKIKQIQKEITDKELPKAVREAFDAKYPKATIQKLEEEFDGEDTKYEAKFLTADKKPLKAEFDPSGKFLEEKPYTPKPSKEEDGEEEIALDKLPAAVLTTLKAKYPKAKLLSAEKEVLDGETLYEVALKDQDHPSVVRLSVDGKIKKTAKELTVKELPKAVRDALDAKYPKANVTKIDEVAKGDKLKYEIWFTSAQKKSLEVEFDIAGKILEIEELD